jgi:hypothetical protein
MKANCNPLGVNHCMNPWPSSVFEVDDATSATGRRLAIPPRVDKPDGTSDGTLPTNFNGDSVDPTAWNLADGFSPAAPIVLSWPGGVSTDGLPPVDDMDVSITTASPTFLYDMTAMQPVAHYAEVDAAADATPDSQAFYIRPAQRLVGGHRYAVAITKAVKAKDGGELAIPPGFAALRDHKVTDHALLEKARPRLEEALDALEGAGFARGDLVVAWDFTVASDEFIRRDMKSASSQALAALKTHAIQYTIMSDQPIGDGTQIKRQVIGTFDAPLFLTNNGAAVSGTTVARDADGLPMLLGFYKVPFTAIVPACAYSASAPVGMVMYGHGLLGDSTQTGNGTQATASADLCLVFVGTDMRGMSTPDVPAVARVLNDASHADEVMEVLEQGLVNHIALAQAMETTFAQTLFVDAANANKVLVDPTKVYYYGLSQGGIFGASVMAYEPTIKRAALGVGAANYSMMLDRSQDWPTYRVILQGGYPDPLDDVMVLNLVQARWDKTEPAGIANTVLAGSPPDVPAKQLLLQNALTDEQVPNIATYWEARTLGIPVMGPSPTTPWGLTVQTAPLTVGQSALVLEDGGAPPAPLQNIPPPADMGMHSLTRNQPASRRQIGLFYSTGQINDECAGTCVCPAQCQ